MDLFEKRIQNLGPLGEYASRADGYFMFPKLEGEISNYMKFRGKEVLVWSLNNYLGLANHPEVREADAKAARDWGLAYPMGARMMSGQTVYHEQLERELADFVGKEDAFLLNYGYQGMVSLIDSLVDRHDIIVYDSEAHACIIDGARLHMGKRFVFPHNNMESLRLQLQRATKLTQQSGGGILVITEGVYGMTGDQGNLREITAMKKEFNFRLLVDDAHGFGTMGATGAGTHQEQEVMDEVDIYFGTFAKAIAGIGAFVATRHSVVDFLRHNMRSQTFAKSLPMPMVIGALKRMELIRKHPELKDNLWKIVNALQSGLRNAGFNLGPASSPVTPVLLEGGIPEATQITVDLRENYNIFCSIVTYPVVPRDVILLRLIPTAVHTLKDVEYTINAYNEVREKLNAGAYAKEMFDISVL
ncbi:MAG: aminotransferase class I/II-fold pyridoxal phosphate-dependent enzyme [Lentimicrobiaceae bacterium]|nr:aminotransferase class I/II-fold pyridoxal phosphate-dependent enzyme [Lentimicrobiaceae bacterium]MDD4597668.1 aminotransferase class I/II-fold pyridoxal phosphate-dependent enzyme [Lentimicrobiaceae bacterium]MDY0025572.1 aminotransferase class I/II-fold pyridoxal phosphate-dependent enzyme [Lentimicrobium sp.]HAH57962.1 8-amino-7-oxononanoate synthase [Bacteroidales bacterium]